ncbi:hypothetical protein CHUAL_010725 [Chamberlinius hualienensis]
MNILPIMIVRKSILLFSIILLLAQTKTDGDEVLACYLKDTTKLESCLVQTYNAVFAKFKIGDAKLKIPFGEPFTFDRIEWIKKSSIMDIHAVLSNFKVWGWSNSKVLGLAVDKKASTIACNITTPYLNCTFDFAANGTILLFPVKGKSKGQFNASNVVSYVSADVIQHGSGVKFLNLKPNLVSENISFKYVHLDNSDPIWEALNKVIAENPTLFLRESHSLYDAGFAKMVQDLYNAMFKSLPASAFIA